MERLTSHCGAINDGNTYYPKSNFATGNLFQQILNTLGKYENTELTPEEIEQNKEYIQILEKENKLIKEQYVKEADAVDYYKKLAKENAKLKEIVKIISNDVIKNKRCFNCVHNMGNVCKYHIGNLDDCSNWEHWQWQHEDKLKELGVEI